MNGTIDHYLVILCSDDCYDFGFAHILYLDGENAADVYCLSLYKVMSYCYSLIVGWI